MVVLAKPSAANRSTAACTMAARVVSAYSSRRLLTFTTLDLTLTYHEYLTHYE
jgi:hypothetical protein